MKRALWRLLLRTRFLLWQHRRHDRLVLETGLGFPLLVLPDVFNPTLFRTTEFLVDRLDRGLVGEGTTVLDIGCGSGALAIAAARWAARIVAVDVNPQAVRCTRINALINGVESKVEAREGDLFSPVDDERFDRVICNPPFCRGRPRTPLDQAFRAGDFADRLARGLPSHLAERGSAIVVLSTDGDEAGFLNAFAGRNLSCALVAERDLISETVRMYQLRPSPGLGRS